MADGQCKKSHGGEGGGKKNIPSQKRIFSKVIVWEKKFSIKKYKQQGLLFRRLVVPTKEGKGRDSNKKGLRSTRSSWIHAWHGHDKREEEKQQCDILDEEEEGREQ